MKFVFDMRCPLLLTRTMLATVLLCALPTLAEPDFLSGDMGLPSSSAGNNLTDSGALRTDDNPPPPPAKITPAQAADLVRRSTGGQVMSVNSQQTENGVVYGVKVLNSGRMRVVRVNGHTGQIINN